MARTAKQAAEKGSASQAGNSGIPVAASKAKAEFLGLIEQVHLQKRAVLISRRGKPIVQIAPLGEGAGDDPFGCLKGTVQTHGDVISPEPDFWEAMA